MPISSILYILLYRPYLIFGLIGYILFLKNTALNIFLLYIMLPFGISWFKQFIFLLVYDPSEQKFMPTASPVCPPHSFKNKIQEMLVPWDSYLKVRVSSVVDLV